MVRGERKKSGRGGTKRGWGGEGSLCSPASLGIDHVTAPAITSDVSSAFIAQECQISVSCKNSREKQPMLNERARQGNKSLRFGSLIKINFTFFITLWPQERLCHKTYFSVLSRLVNNIYI